MTPQAQKVLDKLKEAPGLQAEQPLKPETPSTRIEASIAPRANMAIPPTSHHSPQSNDRNTETSEVKTSLAAQTTQVNARSCTIL
ncbi:hypothetical protein GV64_03410 [Endozoicomonas elysicola]|uniref:Uncharacterized protein n=1 Tax=Endozoicomonas elysicola TaxID=305900 RepID=A0A081K6Z1_9GAMM|nr:hypothetical protein GV64_03410 [Endozoicomonas elysicola]